MEKSIVENNLPEFQNINQCFVIVEHSLYPQINMDNSAELINNLNLNITNYKNYYPLILESLKNNEYCPDLYNCFSQITRMSMKIYDLIEEDMKRNSYLEIKLDFNYLEKLLKFNRELLTEFHKILTYKIMFLSEKTTLNEYQKEYKKYTLIFGKQRTYFYTDLYIINSPNRLSSSTKNILSSLNE